MEYAELREMIRKEYRRFQYIYFQPKKLTNVDRIILQKTLKSF